MAPTIFSEVEGIIIHVLQCDVAYAVAQMCSGQVVVSVEVVQLYILHVAHGINEAVRWVCGDGHCTPIVIDKEAEGMPLAQVTPSFKGIACHF